MQGRDATAQDIEIACWFGGGLFTLAGLATSMTTSHKDGPPPAYSAGLTCLSVGAIALVGAGAMRNYRNVIKRTAQFRNEMISVIRNYSGDQAARLDGLLAEIQSLECSQIDKIDRALVALDELSQRRRNSRHT